METKETYSVGDTVRIVLRPWRRLQAVKVNGLVIAEITDTTRNKKVGNIVIFRQFRPIDDNFSVDNLRKIAHTVDDQFTSQLKVIAALMEQYDNDFRMKGSQVGVGYIFIESNNKETTLIQKGSSYSMNELINNLAIETGIQFIPNIQEELYDLPELDFEKLPMEHLEEEEFDAGPPPPTRRKRTTAKPSHKAP